MANLDKGETKRSGAESTSDARQVSVDNAIDDIARQALHRARRVEEREKCRQPGPIVPPDADAPPIKLPNPTGETQMEIPNVGSRDAPGG
jgi:hypothetical protein